MPAHRIHPKYLYGSRIESDKSEHGSYGGGLAGTVRTYESEYLPFVYIEGHILNAAFLSIVLCKILYSYHIIHMTSFLTPLLFLCPVILIPCL